MHSTVYLLEHMDYYRVSISKLIFLLTNWLYRYKLGYSLIFKPLQSKGALKMTVVYYLLNIVHKSSFSNFPTRFFNNMSHILTFYNFTSNMVDIGTRKLN